MTTPGLATAAILALIPAGLVLFAVLDRYAAPRVPESRFDERKLLLAFVVGIPAGLPLAILFLLFTRAWATLAWETAAIYAVLFAAVAAVERRLFLQFGTFGGRPRPSLRAAFYAFGLGGGNAVVVALATTLSDFTSGIPGPEILGLFFLLSCDLALIEGYAGIRTARARREGFSWLPPLDVLAIEAVTLPVVGTLYLSLGFVKVALLLTWLLAAIILLTREEQRTLRPLLRRRPAGGPRFGRKDGSHPLPEGAGSPVPDPERGEPAPSGKEGPSEEDSS